MHSSEILRTGILILFLCFLGCTQKKGGPAQSASGTIIQIDSFPSAYIDTRPILIWLPSSYTPAKKYAVLYMQDGQMLFDSSSTWTKQEWKVDETMASLCATHTIRDAIVVGIPNNSTFRWAEYLPQAILDSIPSAIRGPLVRKWLQDRPMGDAYLRFIVEELKPYIDREYATLPDAANTLVMGSSMGAIISLYAICEYPDVFGGAGCLSTHWPLGLPGVTDDDIPFDVPGAFRKYLQNNLPSPQNHRIYFDYGSATLDSLYKPHQLLIDSLMISKGYATANWITREFPGEAHTERSWADRLHIPLKFLLGN